VTFAILSGLLVFILAPLAIPMIAARRGIETGCQGFTQRQEREEA
jgi:hypothetical protein